MEDGQEIPINNNIPSLEIPTNTILDHQSRKMQQSMLGKRRRGLPVYFKTPSSHAFTCIEPGIRLANKLLELNKPYLEVMARDDHAPPGSVHSVINHLPPIVIEHIVVKRNNRQAFQAYAMTLRVPKPSKVKSFFNLFSSKSFVLSPRLLWNFSWSNDAWILIVAFQIQRLGQAI
jgi:hypothetical protein